MYIPAPGVVLRGLGASESRMACTLYSTSATSSLLVSRLGTTPARKTTNKQELTYSVAGTKHLAKYVSQEQLRDVPILNLKQ